VSEGEKVSESDDLAESDDSGIIASSDIIGRKRPPGRLILLAQVAIEALLRWLRSVLNSPGGVREGQN